MILQLDASDVSWLHDAVITLPKHIPLPDQRGHSLFGLFEIQVNSYDDTEVNVYTPINTTITFNAISRTRKVLVGLIGPDATKRCLAMCLDCVSGPLEISEADGQRLIDLIEADIKVAPEDNGIPEWMADDLELQLDQIATGELDDENVP